MRNAVSGLGDHPPHRTFRSHVVDDQYRPSKFREAIGDCFRQTARIVSSNAVNSTWGWIQCVIFQFLIQIENTETENDPIEAQKV
jgi:hypothetical protein